MRFFILVFFLIGGCTSSSGGLLPDDWAMMTSQERISWLILHTSPENIGDSSGQWTPPTHYSTTAPLVEPIQIPQTPTISGQIGQDSIFLQTYKGLYGGSTTVGHIGQDNIYIHSSE